MPLLTKACDVCRVLNTPETPVKKDATGKMACEKHFATEPAPRLGSPGGGDLQALQALESRVKKLETFIGENNELAIAQKMNELLDDRLKLLKLDERLKALEKKGGKGGE